MIISTEFKEQSGHFISTIVLQLTVFFSERIRGGDVFREGLPTLLTLQVRPAEAKDTGAGKQSKGLGSDP